jgi:DNA polymerase I-like protein with 3'-5' exonuclease and polymerase domains
MALEISERYFERFPGVRAFQREVSRQVETENCVRTPFGYVIPMYGMPEDKMKIAQGIQQQNPVSHVTKLALLNCWKRWTRDGLQRPILQIHDELLVYTKDTVDPERAMDWLREDMEVVLNEVGGLIIPAEPSYGPNWKDQTKSKK